MLTDTFDLFEAEMQYLRRLDYSFSWFRLQIDFGNTSAHKFNDKQ